MPSPLTQSAKKVAKRARILAAARVLLDEDGVEGLSLRATATHAGVSPAGIYEYFASKEEMIEVLASEGLAKLSERFQDLPARLTPKQELVALGLAYLSFAVEERQLFRLVFSGRICPRTSMDEPVAADSPYARLLQAVVRAASAKLIQASTPRQIELATVALWCQMHGMASLRATYLSEFNADFDKLQRSSLEALIAGL